MGNLIAKIVEFVLSFTTRAGLSGFIKTYTPIAVEIVTKLRAVNTNADFLTWKADAHAQIKAATGQVKDTWITVLIASVAHLTGPGTKTGNWFVKIFRVVWNFLSAKAPELTTLLAKYGPSGRAIVGDLLDADTNAELKDIELRAIEQLRQLYKELDSVKAGLIINAIFENFKALGIK